MSKAYLDSPATSWCVWLKLQWDTGCGWAGALYSSGLGGRARRYNTMDAPTLFHLGWTNSRAHLYHGWTNCGRGGSKCQRAGTARGGLLGPGRAPYITPAFPGIFSKLTRYNFHVAGPAIVLSRSNVVKEWFRPHAFETTFPVTIGIVVFSSFWMSKFGNFIKRLLTFKFCKTIIVQGVFFNWYPP